MDFAWLMRNPAARIRRPRYRGEISGL